MYLTALWITKNEEKHIGKSIDSVKDAVDEMIVVDTGSTDKTTEIAEQKGAKVMHFDWINDFAAARNYALDNAKYGAVIFLDADEYFEEPLTLKDKNIIINGFDKNKDIYVFSVPRDDIELSDGSVGLRDESNRILRNDGSMRYDGIIHEHLLKDGLKPKVGGFNRKLIHTGYTKEILDEKYKRNAKLLDETIMDDNDTFRTFMNQVYILRENLTLDTNKAFNSWAITTPQTNNWEYAIKIYGKQFNIHLLRSIAFAGDNRNKVSRKFVKKYLIDLYKKNFEDYYMSSLMDLIYIYFFDNREDIYLKKFDLIIKDANQKNIDIFSTSETVLFSMLYTHAARLTAKQDKSNKAIKYAHTAISQKLFNDSQEEVLSIIIDNVSEKDLGEAVETLTKLYPYENADNMRFLTRQLLREDTKELYIFYLKQLVENGIATLDDKLIYALLTGGIKNALSVGNAAIESGEEDAKDKVSVFLFILMTAFNADSLYKSNPEGFASFSRIIESYFSGQPLEDITEDEINILKAFYPYIVFLGGKESGYKYLNVFKDAPIERFAAFEEYSRRSRNFKDILEFDTSDIDENDWFVNSKKIYAAIKLKDFDYAFNRLKEITKYVINDEAMNLLHLTAEMSGGEIQNNAYELYDKYIDRFEKMIDWNDILNTGYILDKKDARAGKTIGKMKPNDLKKKFKQAPPKTDLAQYYDVLEDVLEPYKEKNYLNQYFDGLIELIASDVNKEENKKKLKDFLTDLGNEQAAEVLETV